MRCTGCFSRRNGNESFPLLEEIVSYKLFKEKAIKRSYRSANVKQIGQCQ